MSSSGGRIAGKIGQAAATAGKASAADAGQKGVLQRGAKRDPELYVLLAVMAGALSLAGLYFGRKPTSASSEQKTSMVPNSMPWQVDDAKDKEADEHFKYKYHPGGDKSKSPKDAPSALNSVIVPNVNLPKSLHDKYNKWGKDGY